MSSDNIVRTATGLSGRIRNFLSRSPESRRYALRNGVQRKLGSVFATLGLRAAGYFPACQPDSHWLGREHQEFDVLYRRFTRGNSANNGGDSVRLWAFMLNIKQVLKEGVAGDFAELGVWRGNTAAVLVHYAEANQREVFLFDTFEGFDVKDLVALDADKPMAFGDTSAAYARDTIGATTTRCHYVKGYFPDSINAECEARRYALVSLDCDLYEPMRAGLEFFYPRLTSGGMLFLHDYSSAIWNGAATAIDDFCRMHHEHVILMPDKSGSAFLRKSTR